MKSSKGENNKNIDFWKTEEERARCRNVETIPKVLSFIIQYKL